MRTLRITRANWKHNSLGIAHEMINATHRNTAQSNIYKNFNPLNLNQQLLVPKKNNKRLLSKIRLEIKENMAKAEIKFLDYN